MSTSLYRFRPASNNAASRPVARISTKRRNCIQHAQNHGMRPPPEPARPVQQDGLVDWLAAKIKYQESATDAPHNSRTTVHDMSLSRVVRDVLPADGVCVARKLCPCTRSRQTHALGSVGALPNGSPTLFNEGKGFNERPTAPKKAKLKADALSPNLQRFPNGNSIRWAT